MANLRQLSVFCLSLSLLAGSISSTNCKADAPQLKNPPPTNKAYLETDLWQHDANKEWVFTHLLLSAMRVPNREKIDKLQVTHTTRESLNTLREVYKTTPNNIETSSMSDLVYAYSWENSPAWTYAFSGIRSVMNALDGTAERVSFYKEHKAGTAAATAGTTLAIGGGYGLLKYCRKDPVQPRNELQEIPLAPQAVPPNDPPQGGGAAQTGLVAAIAARPYLAIGAGVTYGAFELCSTLGSMYDVSTSLMYYTDRIVNGSGATEEATWINTFYGFSNERAIDHYDGYINIDVFNTMLYGFLTYGKRMSQLKFGVIQPDIEKMLTNTSKASNLTTTEYTPILPDYFNRLGTDYSEARSQYRNEVTALVNKVIDPSSSKTDCRKFVLYYSQLSEDNPDPTYLFSICSVGDYAYAKLPTFPFARMRKSEVIHLVQDVMGLTGSTRVEVMSTPKG